MVFIYLVTGVAIVAFVFTASGCAYNSLTSRQMDRHSDSKNRNQNTGIMEGAEPVFMEGSSKKAVLLIHGFIGSPRDFADFPQMLHQKGFTVSAPLLPGHGTKPSDFSNVSPEELEDFVVRHYRELRNSYEEVDVVGFSMGGSLAVLLTAHEKVDKLVLVEPYLKIAHQWYYLLPAEIYQVMFRDIIPYVYRPPMFKQVNKKESIPKIVDYDYVSLKGSGTAISLGRKALQVAQSIDCPTLIIHAKSDKATDYRESVRLARMLEKKNKTRFVTVYQSNHNIFWDYDAETVKNEILDFIS